MRVVTTDVLLPLAAEIVDFLERSVLPPKIEELQVIDNVGVAKEKSRITMIAGTQRPWVHATYHKDSDYLSIVLEGMMEELFSGAGLMISSSRKEGAHER